LEEDIGMAKLTEESNYSMFCGITIAIDLHNPNRLKVVMK
jgi:hypothetical protein